MAMTNKKGRVGSVKKVRRSNEISKNNECDTDERETVTRCEDGKH